MNILEYLPEGTAIEDVIVLLAAITAFVSTFAVWSALLHRDQAAKRAAMLAQQREALRKGLLAPRRSQEKKQAPEVMKQVVDRLQLARSERTEKMKLSLAQAGWRSPDAMTRYLFAKFVLPFGMGAAALFLTYGANFGNMSGSGNMLATMAMVVLGFFLPEIVIKNATTKRYKAVQKSMPDALDLMVICAEAGLSLDATLSRVADEIENAAPEASDEFSLTSIELGFLPERQDALKNLALRCDLTAVRGMVNTLLQSEKYGTPLAHSLRVLSQESRDERMLKAEEKAARLPALMTVPMIIFILPPLFIVLLGPAVLDVMDNFTGVF
ncbi:MAG: type II secretion system F family protein [Kiloniellales bacterium]|nr:type II secretion system F family protein [Kiloniellales bacterium]